MKPYTTKHILSTIGLTLLIGVPFGYLYGWQYCVLIACAFICYSVAVFFKNPKYEYGYTVKKHNVKRSGIEAIEQALDKQNGSHS